MGRVVDFNLSSFALYTPTMIEAPGVRRNRFDCVYVCVWSWIRFRNLFVFRVNGERRCAMVIVIVSFI